MMPERGWAVWAVLTSAVWLVETRGWFGQAETRIDPTGILRSVEVLSREML